jgi:hypothetical protein
VVEGLEAAGRRLHDDVGVEQRVGVEELVVDGHGIRLAGDLRGHDRLRAVADRDAVADVVRQLDVDQRLLDGEPVAVGLEVHVDRLLVLVAERQRRDHSSGVGAVVDTGRSISGRRHVGTGQGLRLRLTRRRLRRAL